MEERLIFLEEQVRLKDEKIKELEKRVKDLLAGNQGQSCDCLQLPDQATVPDSTNQPNVTTLPSNTSTTSPGTSKLLKEEVSRYSRQLILPEFGVKGQLALRSTSVLIVGAGGLGCPCAVYLAAAGIGRLGIVDYDSVELSNLHRQILHDESSVGVNKDTSAVSKCQRLNSRVNYTAHHMAVNSQNIMKVIQHYDIVVDASDNVATRYLLNDACVLTQKPLVSGSALRFEGQLTVYNHEDGPCYRCLFPTPPPADAVTNCSEGGVVGAVPGVIGTLQALECIKIATNIGESLTQRLLLYDGLDAVFKTIRLRSRQKHCCVCGDQPSIRQLIDYEQFCGASATDKSSTLSILDESSRINVKEYAEMLNNQTPHILVDVRPAHELHICYLPKPAINIPIEELDQELHLQILRDKLASEPSPVIVVCRRGNDSQVAVSKLQERLNLTNDLVIKDVIGGLTSWAKQIDTDFPIY